MECYGLIIRLPWWLRDLGVVLLSPKTFDSTVCLFSHKCVFCCCCKCNVAGHAILSTIPHYQNSECPPLLCVCWGQTNRPHHSPNSSRVTLRCLRRTQAKVFTLFVFSRFCGAALHRNKQPARKRLATVRREKRRRGNPAALREPVATRTAAVRGGTTVISLGGASFLVPANGK